MQHLDGPTGAGAAGGDATGLAAVGEGRGVVVEAGEDVVGFGHAEAGRRVPRKALQFQSVEA
jgi:hypothetical protein